MGKNAVTQLRSAVWRVGVGSHSAHGAWLCATMPTMVVVQAVLNSHSLILPFAFSSTVQ